jgi:hypothetical protein
MTWRVEGSGPRAQESGQCRQLAESACSLQQHYNVITNKLPIAVAARSKAWTVFARSDAVIVGSNPTQGMYVCVRLFYVCVILCVGSGLTTGWSLVQGVLLTVYRLGNWKKKATKAHKYCTAIEEGELTSLFLFVGRLICNLLFKTFKIFKS